MRICLTILFCSTLIVCNAQKKKQQDAAVIGIPRYTTTLTEQQIKLLDSMDVNFKIHGFCYAYSSDKNAIASNGEAHSPNKAQKTKASLNKNGFYLVINEKELCRLNENNLGHKLYVVNTSDTAMSFSAQDSRLDIIPEAKDRDGNWKPIGYLPFSDCGNSYHSITLDTNEFWEFKVPVFKGKFKTSIRYTLYIGFQPAYSSNEIMTMINESQLKSKNKQGHLPSSLMDPYSE